MVQDTHFLPLAELKGLPHPGADLEFFSEGGAAGQDGRLFRS